MSVALLLADVSIFRFLDDEERRTLAGLFEERALDEAGWQALAERVEARVSDAVAFADASPEPPAEWLTQDVYA